MNAAERAARDAQALDFRRAGVALPRIVEQLNYRNAEDAQKGIDRALRDAGTEFDPADVRALELDRLDRLASADDEIDQGIT